MKKQTTYYHTLANGIRIVHCQTRSDVSWLGLMAGCGTRDEETAVNGMAHYIEHTVFKGTNKRTAKQIINRIEDIGGEINAYTTKEETTFYAAVPNRYFGRALELIADMVFHPSFPKQETEKELSVILDEIESYEDSPSELIYEDFEGLVFEGNSLEMPILGTKKSLKRINKEQTARFMQENYCTSEMVMFSLSSLPMQKVIAYAEQYLSDAPYNIFRTHTRVTPDIPDAKQASFRRHTHQTHVMIGGRAYPIGHEKQLALYLLNNILGGGSMNSRLNMSLREQRGLVYTIESTYSPLSDCGYWSIYFASEPQNVDECEQLVRQELRKMTETCISDYTLKKALRQLHGQMAIAAQNQENYALRLAKLMLYTNQAPAWEDTFAEIEQLTPDILSQTAKEIFGNNNIFILKYE
ncbi:MAG: insulinase family protein [Paludibacteraceae bacterium]|nr:insulinase family protein [Paludibacteraceae bacterium]